MLSRAISRGVVTRRVVSRRASVASTRVADNRSADDVYHPITNGFHYQHLTNSVVEAATKTVVNSVYKSGTASVSFPEISNALPDITLTQGKILAKHAEKTWTNDDIKECIENNMLFTWAVGTKADLPLISHGDGIHMVTTDGHRVIDFNSQAMCSHHGHTCDPRIIERVAQQMREIPYIYPGAGVVPVRAQLSSLLADMFPGDLNTFTFPSSGSEAIEAALRAARIFTGRRKVFSSYRSYHGGTQGAMAITGDQRRWGAEPGDPTVVKMMPVFPYSLRWGETEEDITCRALTLLKEQLMYENPSAVAAIVLESVVGTNGVLKYPQGYLEGVREICTEFGIVMICDEVMAGFGRTGKLFGFEHSPGLIPDMVTFAKGVNGAYLPLGGLAMRDHIADHFRQNPNTGYGSTYNAHPTVLASAHEALILLMEKDLVGNARRMESVMIECMDDLAAKHPSVKQCRALGLFGIVDIQKNKKGDFIARVVDPLPAAMAAFKKALFNDGLWTMCRGHSFYCNPPLIITETELRHAFTIIDKNLHILDEAMED